MISKRKLAVVVQRYGEGIVGGAEHHARLLSQQLLSRGHHVEVLTTCAEDYRTWSNHWPAGRSLVDGIQVFRHPTRISRWNFFFGPFNRVVQKISRTKKWPKLKSFLMMLLEPLWFVLQGPYAPSLIKEIEDRSNDFDAFIFFTYLYHPTVVGLPTVSEKSILIPTAHDEEPFYFPRVAQLFGQVRQLVLNIDAERDLIERVYPNHQAVVQIGAMGIDSGDFSKKVEAISPHHLIYIGRIGRSKSTDEIINTIVKRWESGKQDLRLVLAGKVEDSFEIPDHPAVEFKGFVTDNEKRSLFEGALALINPSRFESLSIIVLEALLSQKQVIVSGQCAVLKSYADTLSTVYSYGSAEELLEVLDSKINRNPTSIANELKDSRNWAEERFTWDRVCDNIERAAAQIKP